MGEMRCNPCDALKILKEGAGVGQPLLGTLSLQRIGMKMVSFQMGITGQC